MPKHKFLNCDLNAHAAKTHATSFRARSMATLVPLFHEISLRHSLAFYSLIFCRKAGHWNQSIHPVISGCTAVHVFKNVLGFL